MGRKQFVASASLIALLIMLFATDPRNISSAGLIVPFVLLFVLLTAVLMMYLERTQVTRVQSLRIASLAAALPCLVLVLRSVDQLTFRDGAILACFFVLAGFYVARTAQPKQRP